MRIMGIDYGDARTGVAISDLLCSIVGSTYVVPSRNREKALADLVKLAQEQQVGTIVVGLPRNMDGTEGPRAALCREFAQELAQATGLPVEYGRHGRPPGSPVPGICPGAGPGHRPAGGDVGRAPHHCGGPQHPLSAQLPRKKAEKHRRCCGSVADFGGLPGKTAEQSLSLSGFWPVEYLPQPGEHQQAAEQFF